jgi:hypothetical protein
LGIRVPAAREQGCAEDGDEKQEDDQLDAISFTDTLHSGISV